jgi:putative DNA primase/helicase
MSSYSIGVIPPTGMGRSPSVRLQLAQPGGEAAMSETPINRLIGRLQSHGCNPRETGSGQWKSRCPAHKGRSSNLSVKQADDGAVILHCHHVDATGQTCSAEAIVRSLGLEMRDLFPDKLGSPPGKARVAMAASRNGNGKAWRSPEAAITWHAKTVKGRVSERGPWIYNDPDHFELMRVYRIDYHDPETGQPRKQFRPVYPDAAGWHVGDPSKDRLPLYHLDELTAAGLVYVCEGEKCADLVRGLGLVATTSSHGAQAPGKTDWSPLAGKTVVILPDHDSAGEGYAAAVAGLLAGLDPRPTIKVVRLPVDGEGDDVEQWLEGRPDSWGPEECRAELDRLARAAPESNRTRTTRMSAIPSATPTPKPSMGPWDGSHWIPSVRPRPTHSSSCSISSPSSASPSAEDPTSSSAARAITSTSSSP